MKFEISNSDYIFATRLTKERNMPVKDEELIMDLNSFLESEYWKKWDADNRNVQNFGIVIDNPDRFKRITEAQKKDKNSDGSTHREIMADWLLCHNDIDDNNFSTNKEFATLSETFKDVDINALIGLVVESRRRAVIENIKMCVAKHKKDETIDLSVG